MPSFTFVSTVNAFVLRGARPVFADIRPDTLNLDETRLERLITPHTRAIVPVHYAGVGCEMDAIVEIALARGATVVEDNAHGLFGRYKGRPLGTFGCLATQSFHETKNFTCGEGGALLINDPRSSSGRRSSGRRAPTAAASSAARWTSTPGSDLGSSYLPSDILAAFLLAQLERREAIQAQRARIWARYRDGLAGWAAERGVRLPVVPGHCESVLPHVLPAAAGPGLAPALHRASRRRAASWRCSTTCRCTCRRWGGAMAGSRATARSPRTSATGCVRLPFFNSLSEPDQDRVIDAILSFQP